MHLAHRDQAFLTYDLIVLWNVFDVNKYKRITARFKHINRTFYFSKGRVRVAAECS